MIHILVSIGDFILDNIATIISLIAVIITAFNVNEVRKQRFKMYEPTLILEKCEWKSYDDTTTPALAIRNVGYGTALDIKCKWELIKPINKSEYFKDINETFVITSVPSLETGNSKEGAINKELDFNKEFQYLLPININGDSLSLKIPMLPLLETFGNIRRLLELEESNQNEKSYGHDISEVYPLNLKLTIQYKDINSKIHAKKYSVEVSPYKFQYDFKDNDKWIKLEFAITPKSE